MRESNSGTSCLTLLIVLVLLALLYVVFQMMSTKKRIIFGGYHGGEGDEVDDMAELEAMRPHTEDNERVQKKLTGPGAQAVLATVGGGDDPNANNNGRLPRSVDPIALAKANIDRTSTVPQEEIRARMRQSTRKVGPLHADHVFDARRGD